jgi:hypothetical protein
VTCSIFVHRFVDDGHESDKMEFPLLDNGFNESVSYTTRLTSGFELIDEHTISYI